MSNKPATHFLFSSSSTDCSFSGFFVGFSSSPCPLNFGVAFFYFLYIHSPGDLTWSYGFNQHQCANNSQMCISRPDFSSELQTQISNCLQVKCGCLIGNPTPTRHIKLLIFNSSHCNYSSDSFFISFSSDSNFLGAKGENLLIVLDSSLPLTFRITPHTDGMGSSAKIQKCPCYSIYAYPFQRCLV